MKHQIRSKYIHPRICWPLSEFFETRKVFQRNHSKFIWVTEDLFTLGTHVGIDFHDTDARNKYFEQYHNLKRQNVLDSQILNVSDAFDFEVFNF